MSRSLVERCNAEADDLMELSQHPAGAGLSGAAFLLREAADALTVLEEALWRLANALETSEKYAERGLVAEYPKLIAGARALLTEKVAPDDDLYDVMERTHGG